MTKEIIVLILLVLSGIEIFFNVFTRIFEKLIGLFKKGFSFNEKAGGIFKLIFVAIFLVSVFYFLFLGLKVFADFLGISLDQNIFDIFR